MLRNLIVLILLIISFAGGVYYQLLDQSQVSELTNEIDRLEKSSIALSKRNGELKETLRLVKRQIQTDRIAYKALQDIVENSESQQTELKNQLEKQRNLLESLQTN